MHRVYAAVSMILAIPLIGGAQTMATRDSGSHVRIIGGDSTRHVKVRLVNAGAHVHMVTAPWVEADTLIISTPVELALPAGAFRLMVTPVAKAEEVVLVYGASAQRTHVATRFSAQVWAPVILERTGSNDPVRISSRKMTAERLP